jgi:outer membrane protein OmpA-like peptidoglycan-associated protein
VKALTLSALLAAQVALGQTSQPLPDFSLTRFTLNDGPSGGLGAATGDLLPRGQFHAFAALHYENNPLVYYRDGVRVGALVKDRLSVDLGVGYAFTSWLQLTANVPVVVSQHGDDLTTLAHVSSPSSSGLGSPRVAVRLGLVSQGGGGLAAQHGPLDVALQVGTALPFGVGQSFSVESGWNFAPQLSVGHAFSAVRLGAEVSALVRPQGVTLTTGSLKDQVGSQLGVKALVSTVGEGARFEFSGGTGVSLAGGTPPGFELLVGGRIPVGPLELFALLGPGFGNLPGTPTFRVYGGLGIRPETNVCDSGGPHTPKQCPDLDDDHDGVRNGVDQCPLEPEDLDGFEDEDGCPDPDNDRDGVPDALDRCPNEKGLASSDGCPVKDRDGDGVPDAVDQCPDEAGPRARKGCPFKDQDGDGVEDAVDQCPTEAGPKERKGCPLKDRDGDGVEDARDNCPDVKGTPENQGCPAEQKQLVEITSEKLVIKDKVFFATAKATILPRSFPLLNQVAAVIRNHPELKHLRVEGHTDDTGGRDINVRLSQSRADSVKAYLSHQGVEEERLDAKGFGPDRPADSNATEAGRANNRRVEFVIDGAD